MTATNRPRWIAAIAAIGAMSFLVAFYPGAMSFDTATQWWQVRGGTTDNVHGVGLLWLWKLTDFLVSGPGGIFVLQTAMFWTGLALIAMSLRVRLVASVATMLIGAFSAVPFVLMTHVWSDTLLIATLTLAVGALLRTRESEGRAWLRLVWVLLFFSLMLRHNAVAAVLPLAVYAVFLSSKIQPHLRTHSPLVIAFWTTMLMQISVWELEHNVDERRTLAAATMEWDLAAISLKTGTLLLPPASHGPDLTLDDLSRAIVPYSNTPLFRDTRAGMRQPFYKIDDPLNDDVRDAWFRAIVEHPAAYLSHRWRVMRALFGSHRADWPPELVAYDGEFQFADNPPIAANSTRLHAALMSIVEALRPTIFLAVWPYLVLAFGALVLAWRRRTVADAMPAFAILSSGLLYAAPLPLIAPSAELRYLGWTCVTAILGAALSIAAPRMSEMP